MRGAGWELGFDRTAQRREASEESLNGAQSEYDETHGSPQIGEEIVALPVCAGKTRPFVRMIGAGPPNQVVGACQRMSGGSTRLVSQRGTARGELAKCQADARIMDSTLGDGCDAEASRPWREGQRKRMNRQ